MQGACGLSASMGSVQYKCVCSSVGWQTSLSEQVTCWLMRAATSVLMAAVVSLYPVVGHPVKGDVVHAHHWPASYPGASLWLNHQMCDTFKPSAHAGGMNAADKGEVPCPSLSLQRNTTHVFI